MADQKFRYLDTRVGHYGWRIFNTQEEMDAYVKQIVDAEKAKQTKLSAQQTRKSKAVAIWQQKKEAESAARMAQEAERQQQIETQRREMDLQYEQEQREIELEQKRLELEIARQKLETSAQSEPLTAAPGTTTSVRQVDEDTVENTSTVTAMTPSADKLAMKMGSQDEPADVSSGLEEEAQQTVVSAPVEEDSTLKWVALGLTIIALLK